MSAPSLSFKAGGTLKEGHFYIERLADAQLIEALVRRREFCYVLAPRQMGKSSLRYRAARILSELSSSSCATVDLTGLGGASTTAPEWYFGIIDEIARQLSSEEIRSEVEDFWVEHEELSPVQRFMRAVREILLARTKGALFVFIDEIDAVRALPFSSDEFFAALRALYNARAEDAAYERLCICLLGVAQPGDLIRNEQITPFNIGVRIDLADFDRPQLDVMATGLEGTGANPGRLLDAVYDWTHGHPYMTQRLCEALAPETKSQLPGLPGLLGLPGQEAAHVAALVARIFLRRSEARDANLAYAEKSFPRGEPDPRVIKMLVLYARLIGGERVAADGRDAIQGALLLTGMVAVRATEEGRVLEVRNRIFATVFDAAWVRAQQVDRLLMEPLGRWLESGRNADFVLRGEALRQAEQWAEKRSDITIDEEQFLRACLRVRGEEQFARAESALIAERAARAEAARQREEAERVRAEAEVERAQTMAAMNAEAAALAEARARYLNEQAYGRKRINRLLFLGVFLLIAALIAVYSQYQRAERGLAREQVALKRAKAALEEIELQTRIERSISAKALARQLPGDRDALRLALLALGPSLTSKQEPPPQVIEGVIEVAQARGYQLLPPLPHKKAVATASFSSDGTLLLTAGKDRTARTWDARTGTPLATLTGHTESLHAASFSPDGARRVVTASDDGTARIWDTQTGAPLATLVGHKNWVFDARFSPDGARVVTASSDETARIWDARTGASLATLRGHGSWVTAARFSPDGARVLTTSDDDTARIWDAKTGALLAIFKRYTTRTGDLLAPLKGHPSWVSESSFSPDGTRVLTAGLDGTVRIWNAGTGAPLATLKGHNHSVLDARFSPDGTRVVTASEDGAAHIWDAETGNMLVTLKGHTSLVSKARFSPDGTHVVTASEDGTARLWNARTGAPLATFRGHAYWVNDARFSPDGARVITASEDGTARIWDAEASASLAALRGHTGRVNEVRFSPEGSRVVTASEDGTARIWDARTGVSLATLKGHEGQVNDARFAPDGARVVTASNDWTARIWDAKTGSLLATLKGHNFWVNEARFSPNGTRVVTASNDGTARIWDAKTGSLLATLKGHTSSLYDVSFSPDGARVVTASADGTARVWDAKTGSLLVLLQEHTSAVYTARFSSDGARVATASADRTARIWDTQTGTLLTTLNGHASAVTTADFSPDGIRVITTGEDGTARLFDAKTGTLLVTFKGHTSLVNEAEFSPDGIRVLTASEDGTARLWEARPGLSMGATLATFSDHQGPVTRVDFSPDGSQLLTAGKDGAVYLYSASIATYVVRACALLSSYPDEFKQVAAICQQSASLP